MILFRKQAYIVLFILLGFSFTGLFGQEEEGYEDLLQRVDTVENPVYKPVISLGYGAFNFIGDVKSSYRMPVVGNPAVRFNISTFIDNKHYFNLNFFFLAGSFTASQQSLSDVEYNLHLKSNIYAIGASGRYEFGHFIPTGIKMRPYVSLGVEQLNFDTKGDLFDTNGLPYNYWPDGTIRDIPVTGSGAAHPLVRDYVYETDMRTYEHDEYGLGEYSPRSVGFPVELGFTLKITSRVFFSLGAEYHFTISDYIDNVASVGTHVIGAKGNDGFVFTHATLHFDMFSDPTTRTVDLLFADYDTDYMLFEDEDGDMVLDNYDQCPETPYGVAVDTMGCPFDSDVDGVPDYLDKELDTPKGAWVDDEGVTLSEEDFLASLQRERALKREDLELYMELIRGRFMRRSVNDIPEKFAQLDADKDGYISFDELLKVIDGYFDFKVNLTLDELREVNEYFFSQ